MQRGLRVISLQGAIKKKKKYFVFRITERNLSDIGTIMHVSVMDPLQGM